MLAVLPSKPLKGGKPDVDYLLRVLQTVTIPPIPIKELERFRYDSLRMAKEEDSGMLRRRLTKDELEGESTTSFFSLKPSLYRDKLQAKRQKPKSSAETCRWQATLVLQRTPCVGVVVPGAW